MTLVGLWLFLTAWPVATPVVEGGQATGTLRIRVTLVDDAQRVTPVVRHALLVSANPANTAPRRLISGVDGSTSITLAPGNYTVESDRPLVFQGREYSWTQILDVPAGRDVTLELTAANADVSAATAPPPAPTASRVVDPTDVLTLWQDSVVALWTPTARGSGFVIDASGLVVTNQQSVGRGSDVEVQLSDTLKVQGRVMAADATNDVAVLWVDQAAIAAVKPLPLDCASPAMPTLKNGQAIVALGRDPDRPTSSTPGKMNRVNSRAMLADFSLDEASMGGPVFDAAGALVGLSSFVVGREGDPSRESRVVRRDAVCDVIATARTTIASATAPPRTTPLPMEPAAAIPADVLEAIMKRRAGSLSPYRAESAGFDIALITPVVAYAGQRSMDFANWSRYVDDLPSVLLVRVTPKQVEKLWVKVARGVAMTQGMALPPIKNFKAGFARLRAFCDAAEVTPIHPFLLERRISETDAVFEGLYVFDPDAFGPHCAAVKFEVYSDKAPGVAEPAVVDAKAVQQVWQDFAPYRERK